MCDSPNKAAKFQSSFHVNSSIVSCCWQDVINYINYSNITKNNILFIDVSASRRKPSSGLTSGAGRQYVKACPIRGSTGSSPRFDSCCRSFWFISHPLWVCQLCLILDQSPWRSPSLLHDSHCKHDLWLQICCRYWLSWSFLLSLPITSEVRSH